MRMLPLTSEDFVPFLKWSRFWSSLENTVTGKNLCDLPSSAVCVIQHSVFEDCNRWSDKGVISPSSIGVCEVQACNCNTFSRFWSDTPSQHMQSACGFLKFTFRADVPVFIKNCLFFLCFSQQRETRPPPSPQITTPRLSQRRTNASKGDCWWVTVPPFTFSFCPELCFTRLVCWAAREKLWCGNGSDVP